MTGPASTPRPAAGRLRPAGPTTYPVLHMLRVAAALCIFTGHWSEPYVDQLFPQGQLQIDIFFMIEGFLAADLLVRRADGRAGALVLDRLAHVYPIYLLSLIIGATFFAPAAIDGVDGWTIGAWAKALAAGTIMLPLNTELVHSSVYPLNPPSWAIVLEMVGFAGLCYAHRVRGRTAAFACWVVGLAVWLALAAIWHDPNMGWSVDHYWGGAPRVIVGFFGGALLYEVYARLGMPRLGAASGAAVGAAFFAIQFLRIHLIAWPLVGLVAPILVSIGACVVLSGPPTRWAAWARRNALAIYLLGYPVMMGGRLVSAAFGMPASPAWIALDYAAVVAAILLVAAAWALVSDERRPADNPGRRTMSSPA